MAAKIKHGSKLFVLVATAVIFLFLLDGKDDCYQQFYGHFPKHLMRGDLRIACGPPNEKAYKIDGWFEP